LSQLKPIFAKIVFWKFRGVFAPFRNIQVEPAQPEFLKKMGSAGSTQTFENNFSRIWRQFFLIQKLGLSRLNPIFKEKKLS